MSKPVVRDKKAEEEAAQRARAAALAYLKANNADLESTRGNADGVISVGGRVIDNTLQVVMERKVKDRDEELRRKVKEDQEEFALRAGLPPNWQRVADKVTGETYFWNKSTGQTQWEDPSKPQTGSAAAAAAGGGGPATSQAADLGALEGGTDVPLTSQVPGSPWVEIRDAASGQSFFWNMDTGDRCWDAPVGFEVRWSDEAMAKKRQERAEQRRRQRAKEDAEERRKQELEGGGRGRGRGGHGGDRDGRGGGGRGGSRGGGGIGGSVRPFAVAKRPRDDGGGGDGGGPRGRFGEASGGGGGPGRGGGASGAPRGKFSMSLRGRGGGPGRGGGAFGGAR